MSGDGPLIVLPSVNRTLLDAARTVVATPTLPRVVLIGGLAIAMRVAATGTEHRATVDVDFVTDDVEPGALEVLAVAHRSVRHPLVIEGVQVDVIATSGIGPADLDGLDDHHRLFVAGHRWAFEHAVPARLMVADGPPVAVPVASVSGLIATKSGAVGFPSGRRRATKAPSDLLDLFRLVDLFDRQGSCTDELRSGPPEMARIIADVVRRQVLDNPAAAAHRMTLSSPVPVSPDHVEDVFEPFEAGLRAA